LQPFGLAVYDIAVDGRSDVLVTAAAGVLGHVVVELGDFNSVGIVAAGEVERVPESVISLDRVFSDEVVRRVAVIAGSDRVVARFLPGIVLRLHDMAVSTRGRIVRQVGISLGVDEGICAETDDNTQ
jgi:hypothetical protein